MDRRLRASSLWLGLLALGGLLAGHLVSYFVVAPDAHERAELLAHTGHAHGGVLETLALAATFAAVIGLFMQRVRSSGERSSRAGVAALLWVVQTTGFVVLETWERGHGIAGAAELLHEPAFLIGLVAQLAVALAATAIVLLIRATADALRRLLAPRARSSAAITFPFETVVRARDSVARAAWNLRGPPSRACP